MTKSYVRTATRSTLKVEANLTQILNFKANFHTEFEPFLQKKIYANNVRVSEFEPQTYMKTNAQNDMSRNNLPTENYYNNG